MRQSTQWDLLFPRELTLAICEDLDLNDLKHMRLTCKTLANDVALTALSHIIISAKGATTIERVVSDLQFLTSPERAAVNCSRKITFGDLSSIFLDSNIDKGTVDVAVDHVKSISQELLSALTSFKIIQTVNWCTEPNDPLWLQEIIWQAITEFPNLRHLKMNSLFLKQPLGNFDTLNGLESIKIVGEPFIHEGALFLSLSKLYASSSNLNSITVENSDEYDIELYGAHSLQHLLSSSPKRDPAHRLRCLSLSNIPIRLDEVSLSHLTHLTSLKLSSLPGVFDGKTLSGPPDDIWVAFKRSRTRLEELEVGFEAMADSIIDYLSSFSGLKKLKLSIPNFSTEDFSETSAVKFWSESFPKHVDTIQDFSLRPCYDGQWCFGRYNRSLIVQCTKLRQLTMSLLPEDIPTKGEDFNGINALIDTVVTHMPHVKELGTVVPHRGIYRGHRCGSSSSLTNHRDSDRLTDWVSKYQPPANCQILPRLTVKCPGSVRIFVGIKNDRRSRLKYSTYRSEEDDLY